MGDPTPHPVDHRPADDVGLDAQRVVARIANDAFHRAEAKKLVRARRRAEIVDAGPAGRVALGELAERVLHRLGRVLRRECQILIVIVQKQCHSSNLMIALPERVVGPPDELGVCLLRDGDAAVLAVEQLLPSVLRHQDVAAPGKRELAVGRMRCGLPYPAREYPCQVPSAGASTSFRLSVHWWAAGIHPHPPPSRGSEFGLPFGASLFAFGGPGLYYAQWR